MPVSSDDNNDIRIVASDGVTYIGNVGTSLKTVTSFTEPVSFTVTSIQTALGNNKSMVAIFNGNASNVIKIQGVKLVNNRTTAVTGVVADFRYRRITGLTGGTALTPQSMDTADTLASSITAATGGTVSGESTSDLYRSTWSSDDWGPGTSDVESGDHAQQQLQWDYIRLPGIKPLTLRQNQGLTIKCVTNTTAGEFDIVVLFTQEAI
jgi:hypothetical protein